MGRQALASRRRCCSPSGSIVQFTIGGLSGVTHAVAPSDTQQTDTYYIVAHFHYVLFGGAVLGIFAGFYYWWPKVFGRMLSEKLGKWNFWPMVVGLNMTFGPMHIVGLQGQPRRMYQTTHRAGDGFFNLSFWNLCRRSARSSSPSACCCSSSTSSSRPARAPKAPLDPWDARSLEWMTTSPPKEHNFDAIPTVHHLDEFFHRKYEDDDEGEHRELRQVATAEEMLAEQEANADAHIHMPSPSYWPIVARARPADHGLRRDLQPLLIPSSARRSSSLGIFGWALEPPTADRQRLRPAAPTATRWRAGGWPAHWLPTPSTTRADT